jgi:hypothetical protein
VVLCIRSVRAEPSAQKGPAPFVVVRFCAGIELTVIAWLAAAVQPLALETVTPYVVFMVGETVIDDVVAPPGDQLYCEKVPTLRVTASPWQIFPSLGVLPEFSTMAIVGAAGFGLTVIFVFADPEQP